MSLDLCTKTLAGTINAFAEKLKPGAVIALMIQPTQWNAPAKQYTDQVLDLGRAVSLPVHMRIQSPYESQWYNPQMVEWAKAN